MPWLIHHVYLTDEEWAELDALRDDENTPESVVALINQLDWWKEPIQ